MRPAISRENTTAIASRKKYSASTRTAIVEARSGKSGGMSLLAQHHDNEGDEGQDRHGPANTHGAHDRQTVSAGCRVVVVAVEEQRIDGRPDSPRRRLDQRKAEIAWAVFDAKEITRQAALRRQNDPASWVRELVR